MLSHYFDHFLAEYEGRFEKQHGFLRPIIKDVVERYLDCGNPRCGFARIRYGKDRGEVEWLDYLGFIARVVSHIPDKGQVTMRYYGLP